MIYLWASHNILSGCVSSVGAGITPTDGLIFGIFSGTGVNSVGRMGWLKETEYLGPLCLHHIAESELQLLTMLMLFMFRYGLLLVAAFAVPSTAQVSIPREPVGHAPPLPPEEPHPPPSYMRDNINNYFGTAPDRGSLNGPILGPLNASALARIHGTSETRQDDGYWLASLGSLGQSPFAPSGYQFFRNVRDFGAVGDGVTDDTAAINRAAATFSASDTSTLRCADDCGSTTTLGAVVYFPPGTYLISTPIIQFHYTQFVGNPNNRAVIKGTLNFTGIALVDSNVYIPRGNGDQWYINQSNFYRQIRNLVFDMTGMNWTNYDNDQEYVPAGIHWQVGQATSITNCHFQMAVSDGAQRATAVGIYMENGSGGGVSDLTFFGGYVASLNPFMDAFSQ